MPSKGTTRRACRVRMTRSEQPTSVIDSPVSRLRTELAMREEARRTNES